ncbi:MAG: hypothetical protein WBE76_27700 [Terracidiphilus sp.]
MLPARPGLGAALLLAAAVWPLCARATAQEHGTKAHEQARLIPEKSHPDRLPERPSIPPSTSIPVDPLGFAAPGPIYLGQRHSLASLDFLDESHLLFTFRVPGLIHRQHHGDDEDESEEHHVRAVVLALPSGAVEAESLWMLHDRGHYVWALKDGRFLLRDGSELRLGDASLDLKPYLRFPGPLLSMSMDPAQQLLVTDSREPALSKAAAANVADNNLADNKDPSPRTVASQPEFVLRILHRDSGKVMVVNRIRSAVHLPLNSDGYLEMLPGNGSNWTIELDSFDGSSKRLGEMESTCTPSEDFLSQQEFLITTCTRYDLRAMFAMTTDGRTLWEDLPLSSPVWPLYLTSADGSRMARESLAVTHPVTAFSPLSFDDVRGQVVEVFDSASGKIELTAPANPVLDAGGNVAISPSGRRVAILNAGAIQVFDLPAPPPLPEPPSPAEASRIGPSK